MANFTHVVLTRFNARFDAPWTDMALDPSWLDHRFNLFEQYCYPSLRSQTTQNFHWLIFFSDKTPSQYVNRVNNLSKNWPVMKPRFHDFLSGEKVVNETLSCVGKNSAYLITSTVDNDDAISRNFIEETQKRFAQQSYQYVNWAIGYVYYVDKNRFYERKYLQSPFNSLIEKTVGCKLVWSTSHHEILKTGKVIQIDKNPGWIQVIHNYNISNRIKGRRIAVPDIMKHFEIILESSKKESKVDIFIDRYIIYYLRLIRDGSIIILKQFIDIQDLVHHFSVFKRRFLNK
jgi:hypothetical protein